MTVNIFSATSFYLIFSTHPYTHTYTGSSEWYVFLTVCLTVCMVGRLPILFVGPTTAVASIETRLLSAKRMSAFLWLLLLVFLQ